MEHQLRLIFRLHESMNRFMHGEVSIQGMQQDLEAYSNVIESPCLHKAILIASNKLDECIHFYEEDEGNKLGIVIIEKLKNLFEEQLLRSVPLKR